MATHEKKNTGEFEFKHEDGFWFWLSDACWIGYFVSSDDARKDAENARQVSGERSVSLFEAVCLRKSFQTEPA